MDTVHRHPLRSTLVSQRRFLAASAVGVAVLLVVSSVAGILFPVTYAAETPSWGTQGVAQDWMNLLLAVPLLGIAAWGSLEGSRRALILLAGAFTYVVYNALLYAFAVHFNPLFLVYCATLGIASYGLATIFGTAMREDTAAWFSPQTPVRLAAGVLIGTAVLFGLLWLADIVPALAGGRPASLEGESLFTNPVHVIDLSLILPAFAVAGISLARRRPLGLLVGPALLGFGAMMALSIAFLQALMVARGFAGSFEVAGALAAVGALSAVALFRVLRESSDVLPANGRH